MVGLASFAVLVLVVIPPLYLVTANFAHRLRVASRETRRLAGRKTAVAEENARARISIKGPGPSL